MRRLVGDNVFFGVEGNHPRLETAGSKAFERNIKCLIVGPVLMLPVTTCLQLVVPGCPRLTTCLRDPAHTVLGWGRIISGIKKPACGRLLEGGFGLFLVSRTHLQSVHPAQGVWVWGGAAYCCFAEQSGSLAARGCVSAGHDTGV